MLPGDPLQRLRQRVDVLDARLVDLLAERARIVQAIGHEKRRTGAPLRVPEREREVLARATTRAGGMLPAADVRAVVREVIHGARRLQGVHAVAVLGPAGSHSEIAARDRFGDTTSIRACESMREVVQAVADASVDAAIVPVHNSITGPIAVARDAVAEHLEQLRLREVFTAAIAHCLVGTGPLDAIEEVVSHPEALRQCATFLDAHLPHVRRRASVSSSAAVREVASAPATVAAIGSSRAAALFGATILADTIVPPTYTRFWVLVAD